MAYPASWQECVFIIHANDVGMIGNALVLLTNKYIYFFRGLTDLPVQGLSFIEVPLSHSDTSHSAGFRWTSDRPDAEASI
jgi:hypothetical protein